MISFLSDTRLKGGAAIAADRIARALDLPINWVTGDEFPTYTSALRALEGSEVVFVHNIHGTKDWSESLLHDAGARVIFVLHDMWWFTGGCAYSGSCINYIFGCCDCPGGEDEYPRFCPDDARYSWTRRRRLLASHHEFEVIAPSKWMANAADLGVFHGHKIHHIPYPAPLDTFYPVNKDAARKTFGIPQDREVGVFVAQFLGDARKNGADIRSMVGDMFVVAMGQGEAPWADMTLPHTDDMEIRRAVLSAADVNIHTSLRDNYPNTVIEASCCNVPTITHGSVGGVPEMICYGTLSPREFVEQNNDPREIGRRLREVI